MSDLAPDLIEPFVGWRCWGVEERSDGVWLVSHGGVVWPGRGPLLAECHERHAAPDEDCQCGIYALAERELPYYSYDAEGAWAYPVFGTVALYGRVVRGSRGYRAEKARATSLHLAH